jgi:aryl-alcohol dehydrogenase-like predicted oxidoreductase
MQTRTLGPLEVTAIGYGCMGLSANYGQTPERDASIAMLRDRRRPRRHVLRHGRGVRAVQ